MCGGHTKAHYINSVLWYEFRKAKGNIYYANDNDTKDITVTNKDKVTAQEFVAEQKVLSHDLDDQDK